MKIIDKMNKYEELVAFIDSKYEIQSVKKVVTRRPAKLFSNITISARFTNNFKVICKLKPKILYKIGYIGASNMKF